MLVAMGKPGTLQAAAATLRELKWWGPHENMELLRSHVPPFFPAHVAAASAQALAQQTSLLEPDPDDAIRADLTHLKVLCERRFLTAAYSQYVFNL